MADIPARLKLRAGTIAAWTSANPILAAGEPGFEIDTRILRIGDGSTAFLSLQRFQTSDGFAASFQPIADNLTAFSALTFGANKLPYGTGIASFALTDLTAEGRTFLAASSKAAQRASLELADTALLPMAGETNMNLNPNRPPTRGSVAAAILAVGGPAKKITMTASTTFVKSDHGAFPNDHMVLIEVWGGGGGGGLGTYAGGGGGGSYNQRWVRFADMASSIAVTIGSGGGGELAGGTTTFGFLVSAPGGQGGGGNNTDNTLVFGGDSGRLLPGVFSEWNGANGGTGSGAAAPGNSVVHGGGGGGGMAIGVPRAGGASIHGGNGGAGNAPGIAPGGGGGGNREGARGEVRIWL